MTVSIEDDAWRGVDEGWGRKAADFAALSEPANCREYVAMHRRLNIVDGERLLDIACGAGLAVELAAAAGAVCAGVDASPRLIDVARDRTPGADLRVGDMNALPWADGSFDVVTSFRGIWGTTPDAVAEAHRVLSPGGRIGITVWGHIKKSPGAWALSPFSLAAAPKVANQAAMVALGRPGAGEGLLARAGFIDVERVVIPFAWEFADPDSYARALASTGPAYEAINAVGEEEFMRSAVAVGTERVRDGLPLRAEIDVVGYVARKPVEARALAPTGVSFLSEPQQSPAVDALYAVDLEQDGYVMNASKLWGHWPEGHDELFALLGRAVSRASLTFQQRGVLVSACASTLGDSYCSLAWGTRLAAAAGVEVAAGVLRGDDSNLDEVDRALARWARQVTRDPNAASLSDVQPLRDAGYDDAQILAITVYVGLRLAFSTVNDALGARPDRELADHAPAQIRETITWGRPAGEI